MQGPLADADGADNDGDGAIDEAGERLGMTSFVFHNGGGCVTCDPINAADYYNYMQAQWRDGKHVTLGGNGRDFSQTPTHFMFSGDPVTDEFWTERNSDGAGTTIAPADRRFMMSAGPFTMQPGETQEVFLGIMWAQGADHLASVGVLRQVTQAVRDAFEGGFGIALPAAPVEAVRLASPADRATGQPTNPTLHWSSVARADEYQIELATDEVFSVGARRLLAPTSSFVVDALGPDSTYYWRVRGANAGGFGPWSDAWRFSTSNTVLVNGGVLTFDDGSPAFVEVVGPGGADPCGAEAGSTFGYGEFELFERSASDRVYAYYPIENTSYDDYATLMGPLVDSDPNGCPTDPATATAANLIDFGRGRPIQRVVFLDNTEGARSVADLTGTVIRFYTTALALSPPAPSSPVNRAVSLPFTVTLWWSAPPGAVAFDLQVSANADFTANVVDASGLTASSFTATNFPVVGSYYWRVRAVTDFGAMSDWSEVWAFTVGTATAVDDADAGIPATFQPDANYPNPFNPATTIRFGLPVASPATMSIYNVLGQRVATLVDGHFEAGWHTVQWNAPDAGSGVYFYRIEAGAFRETRTMLLLK